MSDLEQSRVSAEELATETATLLPAKEVLSLLDVLVDLDVALDLAAPVDLAVAANANVAAPITASVGANVLSVGSTAASAAEQGMTIEQTISGDALAHAPQTSVIDQTDDTLGSGDTTDGTTDGSTTTDGGTTDTTVPDLSDPTQVDASSLLDGSLINVNVDAALDADLTAPIAGAVAANANAAAPINVSAAANVLSVDSEAASMATQTGSITQNLDDVTAEAIAEQDSTIEQ